MHPDGAATYTVLDLAAQRLHQVSGALYREADHINDDVRLQFTHALSKGAGGFFSSAIYHQALHRLPGRVGLIRLVLTAADTDDLMTGFHQAGHQKSAHVSGATQNHDAHDDLPNFT
jgi:hypothetical protein